MLGSVVDYRTLLPVDGRRGANGARARPGGREASEWRQLVTARTSTRLTRLLPTVALQALRQKKVYENELDSIAGRKLTLETQVRRPPSPSARPR